MIGFPLRDEVNLWVIPENAAFTSATVGVVAVSASAARLPLAVATMAKAKR